VARSYCLRLSLLFFSAVIAAVPLFAVSYVVPRDRFEIERSSAIIIGRVLGAHVERSPQFGIETVTEVALEEAIKGGAGSVVRICEPGGVLGDEVRLIPGVPGFTAGDRVLLFLNRREDGEYVVTDLQLGSFQFVNDATGRSLVLRNESELAGWDIDGSVHEERQRGADAFIDYVRAVVRGDEVAEDYFVATTPLAGAPRPAKATAEALRPVSNGAFTATSYTVDLSGGLGSRWNVFPGSVNWNQGNSEIGLLGNGTSQINAAFAAWNAGGAHYVLASATPNANGIAEAADGINNAVFEKNLAAFGAGPFVCGVGGVLGAGGIHFAHFGAGNHVFNGETFGTTVEVDLSMNQGLGTCSLAQVPIEAFYTTVTHEVGHTLGFRHSDQNRTQNALCSSDPSLDCSNSAVMDHLLLVGLNGHLQPWDSRAVAAVYGNGAACTPPSISQQPIGSTITSGGSAQLSVGASGTPALTYQWYAGASGNTASPVSGGIGAAILVTPAVTTSYWVRVTGQCAPAADSAAATITIIPCQAPQIINQPQNQTALNGTRVSLTVGFIGASPTVTWYQGAKGDTSKPVGSGQTITSPALTQTTQFWARISNSCGSIDSNAATITVTATVSHRRAASH
jgi:Ig-like domain CHU_C associated/Dual-action HEIGH metallo-peptidase